ncbi:MAG TPA: JAB domain-containing protein [Lacunisphaera sp.]|nr:JAB domain-containing protein [Lacunisphaera sp.]
MNASTTHVYRVRQVKIATVAETRADEEPVMGRPEMVAEFFRKHITQAEWYDPEKECFIVFCLDRKNRLKGWNLATLGTATSSLAHPREVFRAAILMAASAVICLHNHPSGDPAPSAADVQVTRQLRDASKTVDIELLDHVIVGTERADPVGRGFYSFRESGVL